MSAYSAVHATGKTHAGGWKAGLRSVRYQSESGSVARLPTSAVAATAALVRASVRPDRRVRMQSVVEGPAAEKLLRDAVDERLREDDGEDAAVGVVEQSLHRIP